MLSFNPVFSLSSFIFIKRLFSSFSLSVIRVVSSAYLRLLKLIRGFFENMLDDIINKLLSLAILTDGQLSREEVREEPNGEWTEAQHSWKQRH